MVSQGLSEAESDWGKKYVNSPPVSRWMKNLNAQ
jgi:hypothetical protein